MIVTLEIKNAVREIKPHDHLIVFYDTHARRAD